MRILYLPWEYMPQSDGRIYHEGTGKARRRRGAGRSNRRLSAVRMIGNPVYPPARRKLLEQRIPCGQHAARQMTRADYDRFDLLIGMDRSNLRIMQRICGGDPDGKLHLLLDFTDRKGEEVADPWYTGDFDAVWEDLLEGCQALLREYR